MGEFRGSGASREWRSEWPGAVWEPAPVAPRVETVDPLALSTGIVGHCAACGYTGTLKLKRGAWRHECGWVTPAVTVATVRAHTRADGAAQRVVTWRDRFDGRPRRKTVPLDYSASGYGYAAAVARVFPDALRIAEDPTVNGHVFHVFHGDGADRLA